MSLKVSAIITTFNRANLLGPAIDSVLAQSYSSFELLVLDNSSSDNTEEVVRRFSDPRVRYIRHDPIGISAARNLGVREARGEYVGFLDDDDEWLPDKLLKQINVFEKSSPAVGLVYGGFYRVNPDGAVYYEFRPTLRGNVLESYLCGTDQLGGSASNPLMRRHAVLDVGGYSEKIKTSEDWEMYLRLARKYEFEFVPEPIVNVRRHAGPRLGDRLKDAAEAQLLVCEEFPEIMDKNPKCHSFYLQTIGGKYCRIGEPVVGRKYIREAIAKNPFNLYAILQLILSYLGNSAYNRMHKLYKIFR